MAKKRGYNVDEIKTEYERSLNQQEQRDAIENETAKEDEQPEINEKAAIDTHVATEREEPYVDPDYEDYKRISLFMDFETWERIQAVCWKEKSAVNKLLVEHLREWSLKLPESDVDEYRHFKEEQTISFSFSGSLLLSSLEFSFDLITGSHLLGSSLFIMNVGYSP